MPTGNGTAHKQARTYLERLYENAEPDDHLIALTAFKGDGKNITRIGTPAEVDDAATWAVAQSERGYNVFARVSYARCGTGGWTTGL